MNGDVIPAEFLNGTEPAVWREGGCAIPCLEFQTYTLFEFNDGDQLYFKAGVFGNPGSPELTREFDSKLSTLYTRPVYPALGTFTFTYNLVVPAGVVYAGVTNFPAVNDLSKTWTDLPYSDLPYVIEITDDTTGCKTEIPVIFQDPQTPEQRNCFCAVPGAFNDSGPVAGEPDPCGFCWYCDQDVLIHEGIPSGENLILNENSLVQDVSYQGLSDGVITFNGGLNQNVEINLPILTAATYTVTLYSVSGPAAFPPNLLSFLAQGLALTSPDYVFTGLPEGHYMVYVYLDGYTCVSAYRFYVGEPSIPITKCGENVEINIAPCSGQVNLINQPSQYAITSITWYLNGNPSATPPVVEVGETIAVSIDFTDPQCIDYTSDPYTVQEIDRDCQTETPDPIYGCTDPGATNYNPAAAQDDGSCFYGIGGCTDVTALNYDPQATFDNNTCEYGIRGCTDPAAHNYDPNATSNDGSCHYCEGQIIAYAEIQGGGFGGITFVNEPANYTVVWSEFNLGLTYTVEDSGLSPEILADGVWVVTVTDNNGCSENYVLGVNTTPVFGCLDLLATNFHPPANVSMEYYDPTLYPNALALGVCEYRLEPSVCIPPEIMRIEDDLLICISSLSTEYLTRLRAGMLKNCNDKNIRLLTLLQYLVSRKGLECLYNCADSISPTYSETEQGTSCVDLWEAGSPSGDNLIFDTADAYVYGDLVQHPTSGHYYSYIGEDYMQVSPTPGPETVEGLIYWERCREPAEISDTTNRLDAYITFIREVCKDCNIPGAPPVGTTPDPETGDDGTHMDGVPVDVNGTITNF